MAYKKWRWVQKEARIVLASGDAATRNICFSNAPNRANVAQKINHLQWRLREGLCEPFCAAAWSVPTETPSASANISPRLAGGDAGEQFCAALSATWRSSQILSLRTQLTDVMRCRIHTMSERLVTALVVDAVALLVIFEGEGGRALLGPSPIVLYTAGGLAVVACAVGTWKYLKSPDTSSDQDKRRTWLAVSFLTAILVVFWQDRTPPVPFIAIGFFLVFAIGKVAHHN